MDLRLTSAYFDTEDARTTFAISGGGNGISVTKFATYTVARTQRRDNPRGHGTRDLTKYQGGRFFNIEGRIATVDDGGVSTPEEKAMALVNELAEMVAPRGTGRNFHWQTSGESASQFSAVQVDGNLDWSLDHDSRGALRWAVTLFAGDPRRYAETESTYTYHPTLGGSLNPVNDGNFSTPPKFFLTGPMTNPRIVLTNTGTGETQVLQTTGLTIASGDLVILDMATKTIYLNSDGVLRPDWIDAGATTWWELYPQDANQVDVTDADGTHTSMTSTSEAEIIFRSASI